VKHHLGIDVSLAACSLCLVDGEGRIAREGKVACEPEAILTWLAAAQIAPERVGLEAGPPSPWLHAGLSAAGLAVTLLETRHVKAALSAMAVKTDRNDARGWDRATAPSRLVQAGACQDLAGPRGPAVPC
jgi:transposase